MNKGTFLEENQIFDENALEVLKKYGTACAITDFSILLGGLVSDNFTNEGNKLKDRTGCWWTKTPDNNNNSRAVNYDGSRDWNYVFLRGGGARPALPYSLIESISSNKVRVKNDILEVEYGEYPQTIASIEISRNLENAYKNGVIEISGKEYTTDSIPNNDYSTKLSPKTHREYIYNGKKYIRIIPNCNAGETLSNGRKIEVGEPYWVEVEPIKWIISEKENIALCKKIIFSGVQFNNPSNYTGDFEITDISQFMNDTFLKEIEPTNINTFVENKRKTRLQKINPDVTNIEERQNLTLTEKIHDWIENGQSVLLRGPSGIGKTERIKTLYPDLIYIKLTNNMFPEKVVGSMNLQTGQNIPPDFYKQAMLSCATLEEQKLIKENIQNLFDIADKIYERSKTNEKKIVLLLDELLNVKPAVQSLVYTLVLNRLVEIDKGLKLPENVVVVATGNQKKYSSVAQDLAEPLEKRFDHILDMDPKVGEWLYEYAIPNKIHPTVISFILSNYLRTGKSEEIKDMGYFYEEPEIGEIHKDKYGTNGRTNDPRGWVSISTTLYKFEKNLRNGKYIGKNVEDILETSINTKLRPEWASAFYRFYNIPTVSVKEVIEKTYTEIDLPQNSNECYACISALLTANREEIKECREFVRRYCGAEYLTLYEIWWIGNDVSKMERIQELQALNTIKENTEGMKLS